MVQAWRTRVGHCFAHRAYLLSVEVTFCPATLLDSFSVLTGLRIGSYLYNCLCTCTIVEVLFQANNGVVSVATSPPIGQGVRGVKAD